MNALDTAIYNRLSGGTALTALLAAGTASLFHLQAPEGGTLPYVVWNIQGGGDLNQTPRRVKKLLLFVRGYSGSSAAQAGSIDAQVDTALHLIPLTVSGWTDIWLARVTDVETVENQPSGNRVWMAGGMYEERLNKN